MKKILVLLITCVSFTRGTSWCTHSRKIVLTIDDQPLPGTSLFSLHKRTEKIINACEQHGVKAAFFCVGQAIADHDATGATLTRLDQHGHILGNHSYTHSFFSASSLADLQDEISKTEKLLAPYKGMRKWFRFPYLDYGHLEKKGGSAEKVFKGLELLKTLTYKDAYVTINTFDFYINSQLHKAVKRGARIDYGALKKVYLELLQEWVDFYSALYAREIPQPIVHTILFHANDLNALYLGDIIAMLRARGLEIVYPERAFEDTRWRDEVFKNAERFSDEPASLTYAAIDKALEKAAVFSSTAPEPYA